VSRKLVTSLLVIGGVLLLLVVVLALSIPSESITTSEGGTHTLKIAMLSVPIAETEPLVESPNQFLGVPHPNPEFDTSGLGPDLTLQQDTSDLSGLDSDEVLRAVYLGEDVDGEPYYIWHSGSPDLRRMIGQIIADFGAVGRLQTSYGTVAVGEAFWENSLEETIAERGLTTGSILTASDQGTTFTAEWHGLPEEVAVVVLYQDGEPVGWQRPVSRSAAFQFVYELDDDALGLDGGMVALTATGEEWNRFVLFPR
jgi:hypothetical protein